MEVHLTLINIKGNISRVVVGHKEGLHKPHEFFTGIKQVRLCSPNSDFFPSPSPDKLFVALQETFDERLRNPGERFVEHSSNNVP